MKEPTLFGNLVGASRQLPQYILHWVVGLIIAVINDYAITAFAVTGVFAGLAFSNLYVGFFTFFAIYSVFRVVGNLAEAIHAGLKILASLP